MGRNDDKKESVVWVTPSDGVVYKKNGEDNVFTNEKFVQEVSKDKSAIGYMMASSFPAETTITLSKGVPESWVKWAIPEDVDMCFTECEKIISQHEKLPEIPGGDRLWIPRKDQSIRIRHILKYANFIVSPRGIKSNGIPKTINDTIVSTVYSIYAMVEKSTIASIQSRKRNHVSPKRLSNMLAAYDIVSRRKNIADVLMITSYAEPSTTASLRFYYLTTILGLDNTHRICDRLYYGFFETQLYSIEETLSMISEP